MIKIAIVDDEKKERDSLVLFFEKLQMKMEEKFEVNTFESGEAFLLDTPKTFDLICMDIDMGGIDGVETAKEIRKQDSEVIILFITNMAQMAIKGYEVQALDFVLKPVNYYSFAMKMQNAISMIQNKKTRNIVLPTSNGVQKISTDKLFYVEVDGHYLYYHTAEGIFKQKASLKELEDKLEGLTFKRCNNCYLINLKYVDCVNKDELRIQDEWLKISRPRKKDFMQALANYMGGISL